jgi:uncharacterized protein YjbI with pentapeptide repeats
MNRYKTRKYRKRRERRKRRRTVKGGVSSVAPSGQGPRSRRSVAPEGVEPSYSRKRTLRQTVRDLVSLQLPKNALAKLRLNRLNHKIFHRLNLSNIDLEGYDLQNKEFINCTLTGCNLTGANLSNTKFISCDLTGAHLTRVTVNKETSFKRSTLTDIIGLTKDIISNSHDDMTEMKLCRLNLTGFDFRGKTLKGVNFNSAILKEAIFNSKWTPSSKDDFDKPTLPENIFKNVGNDMNGIQLCGLDLTRFDFSGKKLENANFTGSILKNAYFDVGSLKDAKFKYAIFSETRRPLNANIFKDADEDMSYIDFFDCNLTEFDFSGKNLTNANMKSTNCTNTIFTNAKFDTTSFGNATFRKTIGLHKDIFNTVNDLGSVEFIEVDLSKFDFTGKSLEESSFIKTNLKGVNFENAKLNAAKFKKSYGMDTDIFKRANTDMKDISFFSMDLTGIDFSEKSLEKSSFIKTNLKGVNFENAKLNTAKFDESYGMDTDIFKRANTDMKYINFFSMDLIGIDFTGKDLSVKYKRPFLFNKSNVNNVILQHATINVLTQLELNQFNVDMTGIKINVTNLSSIDFIDKNLKDVDFTSKNLKDVGFKHTNLEGTKFDKSTLLRTTFIETTGISEETFRNALELREVSFGDLTDINFSNIKLVNCDFNGAILTRVTFNTDGLLFAGTTLNKCVFNSMLTGSLFSGATLNECVFNNILRSASFPNATLNTCVFNNNLRDLDFSNATLNKCEFGSIELFRRIDLIKVNFTGSNLREIDLTSLTLKNINMTKANLIDAKLKGTYLNDVKFVEADLIGANFGNSTCNNVDFSYADLTRSNFTGVKYSNATFTGSICVGIQLSENPTNYYPEELIDGNTQTIAEHPFPEMVRYKVKGTETIYSKEEATKHADAYQIHKVFGKFLTDKMGKYLNEMKQILNKNSFDYSTSEMKQIYSDLASNLNKDYIERTYVVVPLKNQSPMSVTYLINERIITGNKEIGYKSTYDNDTIITPYYLDKTDENGIVIKTKHAGYRITNSVEGLKYRMDNVMQTLSVTDINTQENRNAIGAMGEFLTKLPPSLDEFKTTYLVEFINSTFYSYGNLSLGCQSCVLGILERVFEIFINTISTYCINNDKCGDNITRIARVFDIDLNSKRDTIQDETINPILTNWFYSVEHDKKIGPTSTSDTIEQNRLLSFLKFVKTALRKEKIDYQASLIGYDASVDINNYMIKLKEYICGAQLGGRKTRRKTA